ncbi:SIT4 phosphatase-associated protein domain-containing protein [Phthorimaea operculella]|nr:SIT4 phosphatase-associated protein domain-containing protein [Phthorimaea operculella]
MFWSGNYIAVRELNFLLKEENVSLTQVLEADDILQECKADNKALIQFLTKPEVLAELITLITEEPPKNVELASQYRHASIACEVLTSHLSTLADRLSLDTVQMNRLCDFINKEPPLNPLLASYFSKTVEMLLERSPKQDWYLYHIVCLRVLDFFRSRRDFLPNLLRHIATSAIADTFKALLRLDDLFNKLVMEWLDEHQFLESLIAIICGSYGETEKAEAEISEKTDANHKDEDGVKEEKPVENSVPPEVKSITITTRDSIDGETDVAASRWRAVAAANAASLLCDLVLNGCAGDHCTARLRTVWVLVSRLQSEEWVRALLGGMFTSPASARQQALVHGCQVLLALLSTDPILAGQCAAERTSVELAVAPHLPLLHQTLLQDYTVNTISNDHDGGGGNDSTPKSRVGAARVHVAALLAQLALSEVEDVPTTMITLGTPGTLVDLFFKYPDNNFLHAQVYAFIKHSLNNRAYRTQYANHYPDNNFLHAQVYAFIKHSLNNRAYRTQYANHLLVECDLLNRLMDVFEENENKRTGVPRAGYMGHVILALRRAARALSEQDNELLQQLRLPESTKERWTHFTQNQLQYAAQQHDTPLLLQQLRLPESTKERWTHFTQNQLQYAAQQHDTPLLLQQLRLPESTKERWTHFTQNQLQYAAQQHDTPLLRLPDSTKERWTHFTQNQLQYAAQQHDTPLVTIRQFFILL